MTSGVKTALIVVGSAVGALVLFRLFAPTPAAIRQQASNSGLANLGGLANLASGLVSLGGSLFGGSSSSAPNGGTYHADTSGFTISGNTLDDASGNAVTYGTD